MIGKYILAGFTHFLFIALCLKILAFFSPFVLISYYYFLGNVLVCAVIAKLTFGVSKHYLLSERINPENKAVLITGAARGIGNFVAKHLDSKGFHVFASCRDAHSPGADDLRKSCSKRLRVLELDVRSDESVKRAAEYVRDNLGGCEFWAVVNNAGIHQGAIIDLSSIEDFKDSMDVNLFGAIRVIKAFLPLLKQSRGRVVNMSSLGGRFPVPVCGPYATSKWAVEGFSKYLALDLDVWGIRVATIAPEMFQTDMTSGESILGVIEQSWKGVDEEVRKDYGDEFLQGFKTCCSKAMTSVSTPRLDSIAEDVESAIALVHPDAGYQSSRNSPLKFLLNLFVAYPTKLQIIAVRAYYFLLGMPKPQRVLKEIN